MTLKKYWKLLVALLLAIILYRLFVFDVPPPPTDYSMQDDNYQAVKNVPQLPEQRDQRAMRDRVIAGDVWGWPEQLGAMTEVPQPDEKEAEPEIPGWQFVGVLFDGRQWLALLLVTGEDDPVTQAIKAGESLPSGQQVLQILENEMLIEVNSSTLSAFVSETDDDTPTPYAELKQQAEQGNSEVLVKVGFNFEQ